MIDDVQQRIEAIHPAKGAAVTVFPRRVVVLAEAGDLHEQPLRTVGLLPDQARGCVGALLQVPPGDTETALRQNIVEALSSDYAVNPQTAGQPILISKPTEEIDDATTTEDSDDCGSD